MPSADSRAVRRIVNEATMLGLESRTVPLMHEFFDGSVDAYKIGGSRSKTCSVDRP